MQFCFIVEEQYKNERMPMAVVDQLRQWQHTVDLLEPHTTITSLHDLTKQRYDAYILKTVSDGPGLSLLQAAEAVGLPTINRVRAIRLVRDKAVAMALDYAHDIPIPQTYFVADPQLLKQVPSIYYPLVIKPTNGSSGRGIYRVNSPAELERLQIVETESSFFLAQHYMENSGFDIKMYVMGHEVFSVAKSSPLHPEVKVEKKCIPTTVELQSLALRIGKTFGLDIYGLDIVETPHGPVVVDINDFPSFGLVPGAVPRIARYVLHLAKQQEHNHRPLPPSKKEHDLLAPQRPQAVEIGPRSGLPLYHNSSSSFDETRGKY